MKKQDENDVELFSSILENEIKQVKIAELAGLELIGT